MPVITFFKSLVPDELIGSIQYFYCFSKRKESLTCNFLLFTEMIIKNHLLRNGIKKNRNYLFLNFLIEC
jgi:hypothetical protein